MNVVTDPVTKEMLIEALQKLGVSSNQILEVHASLSSFHNVIGGREFRSCKKYRILNRGLFTTFFNAYFCQISCICLSYFIVFCDIIFKGEYYACYYYKIQEF